MFKIIARKILLICTIPVLLIISYASAQTFSEYPTTLSSDYIVGTGSSSLGDQITVAADNNFLVAGDGSALRIYKRSDRGKYVVHQDILSERNEFAIDGITTNPIGFFGWMKDMNGDYMAISDQYYVYIFQYNSGTDLWEKIADIDPTGTGYTTFFTHGGYTRNALKVTDSIVVAATGGAPYGGFYSWAAADSYSTPVILRDPDTNVNCGGTFLSLSSERAFVELQGDLAYCQAHIMQFDGSSRWDVVDIVDSLLGATVDDIVGRDYPYDSRADAQFEFEGEYLIAATRDARVHYYKINPTTGLIAARDGVQGTISGTIDNTPKTNKAASVSMDGNILIIAFSDLNADGTHDDYIDVWEVNPATDAWTKLNSGPIEIDAALDTGGTDNAELGGYTIASDGYNAVFNLEENSMNGISAGFFHYGVIFGPPSAPTITGQSVTGNQVTIDWDVAVPQTGDTIDLQRIWYDDGSGSCTANFNDVGFDPDATNAGCNSIDFANDTTNNYEFTGNYGTTYRFAVFGRGAAGFWSDGSSTVTETTDPPPPATISSITPAVGPESGHNEIVIDGLSLGTEKYKYSRDISFENWFLALNDQQMYIVIDTASLIAAGKMQEDCDDLALFDQSGETLLDYWVQPHTCNTAETRVWTRVADLPAYAFAFFTVKYGNSVIESEDNPEAVFEFFDDFDDYGNVDDMTAKWTDISIVDGKMGFTTHEGYGGGGAMELYSADGWGWDKATARSNDAVVYYDHYLSWDWYEDDNDAFCDVNGMTNDISTSAGCEDDGTNGVLLRSYADAIDSEYLISKSSGSYYDSNANFDRIGWDHIDLRWAGAAQVFINENDAVLNYTASISTEPPQSAQPLYIVFQNFPEGGNEVSPFGRYDNVHVWKSFIYNAGATTVGLETPLTVSTVTIDGQAVLDAALNNDGDLVVEVPPSTTGGGFKDVVVTNDLGGSDTEVGGYEYKAVTLSSVIPGSGLELQEQAVEVDGTNLTYADTIVYEIPVTLDNTTAVDYYDHQLFVEINTEQAVADNIIESDCSNIWLFDETGQYPIPIWIQPNTCGTTATKIWFREDLLSTNTEIIADNSIDFVVKYGRQMGPSPQDPESIFLYFDDFEDYTSTSELFAAASDWTNVTGNGNPDPSTATAELTTNSGFNNTKGLLLNSTKFREDSASAYMDAKTFGDNVVLEWDWYEGDESAYCDLNGFTDRIAPQSTFSDCDLSSNAVLIRGGGNPVQNYFRVEENGAVSSLIFSSYPTVSPYNSSQGDWSRIGWDHAAITWDSRSSIHINDRLQTSTTSSRIPDSSPGLYIRFTSRSIVRTGNEAEDESNASLSPSPEAIYDNVFVRKPFDPATILTYTNSSLDPRTNYITMAFQAINKINVPQILFGTNAATNLSIIGTGSSALVDTPVSTTGTGFVDVSFTDAYSEKTSTLIDGYEYIAGSAPATPLINYIYEYYDYFQVSYQAGTQGAGQYAHDAYVVQYGENGVCDPSIAPTITDFSQDPAVGTPAPGCQIKVSKTTSNGWSTSFDRTEMSLANTYDVAVFQYNSLADLMGTASDVYTTTWQDPYEEAFFVYNPNVNMDYDEAQVSSMYWSYTTYGDVTPAGWSNSVPIYYQSPYRYVIQYGDINDAACAASLSTYYDPQVTPHPDCLQYEVVASDPNSSASSYISNVMQYDETGSPQFQWVIFPVLYQGGLGAPVTTEIEPWGRITNAEVTSNSITIDWESLVEVNSYQLVWGTDCDYRGGPYNDCEYGDYYYLSDGDYLSTDRNFQTVITSHNGSPLVPGATYLVSLNAYANNSSVHGSLYPYPQVSVTIPFPSEPFLSAASENEAVNLTWDPPNSINGTLNDYIIRYGDSTICDATAVATLGNADCTQINTGNTFTEKLITGLINGTNYNFAVFAASTLETTDASNVENATPQGRPDAPDVWATSVGDGSVTFNWSVPNGNGSEIVEYYINYGSTYVGYSGSTPCPESAAKDMLTAQCNKVTGITATAGGFEQSLFENREWSNGGTPNTKMRFAVFARNAAGYWSNAGYGEVLMINNHDTLPNGEVHVHLDSGDSFLTNYLSGITNAQGDPNHDYLDYDFTGTPKTSADQEAERYYFTGDEQLRSSTTFSLDAAATAVTFNPTGMSDPIDLGFTTYLYGYATDRIIIGERGQAVVSHQYNISNLDTNFAGIGPNLGSYSDLVSATASDLGIGGSWLNMIFIAGRWADYTLGGGQAITYSTGGTAPNRYFIIDYSDMPVPGAVGGETSDFQIKIYESSPSPEPPFAPNIDTLITNDEAIDLTWSPNNEDPADPITNYILRYGPADTCYGGYLETLGNAACTQTSVGLVTTTQLTGLTNGTNYNFRVFAENSTGTSGPSNERSGIPVGRPDAPTWDYAATTSSTNVPTVYWNEPINTGGSPIVEYEVHASNYYSGWLCDETAILDRTDTSCTSFNSEPGDADFDNRMHNQYGNSANAFIMYVVFAKNSAGQWSDASEIQYVRPAGAYGSPPGEIQIHLEAGDSTPRNFLSGITNGLNDYFGYSDLDFTGTPTTSAARAAEAYVFETQDPATLEYGEPTRYPIDYSFYPITNATEIQSLDWSGGENTGAYKIDFNGWGTQLYGRYVNSAVIQVDGWIGLQDSTNVSTSGYPSPLQYGIDVSSESFASNTNINIPESGEYSLIMVAGRWVNIDLSKGGSVYYEEIGTAPNRALIVTYLDVAVQDTPGYPGDPTEVWNGETTTFQIKILESEVTGSSGGLCPGGGDICGSVEIACPTGQPDPVVTVSPTLLFDEVTFGSGNASTPIANGQTFTVNVQDSRGYKPLDGEECGPGFDIVLQASPGIHFESTSGNNPTGLSFDGALTVQPVSWTDQASNGGLVDVISGANYGANEENITGMSFSETFTDDAGSYNAITLLSVLESFDGELNINFSEDDITLNVPASTPVDTYTKEMTITYL